ncbi:MAG: aldehyde dehydrogenase family protein [Sphingomonas sp.]
MDLQESQWPARQLIDGDLVESPDRFAVVDPARGEVFAWCPDATLGQLDLAADAARRASTGWAHLSFEDRRTLLRGFAARLREAAPALAPLLSREQGKPIRDAEREIMRSAEQITGLSAIEIPASVLRQDEAGRVVLEWRPVGVVAGIVPWNVPVALAMHKLAQALYTGNCLILKPSPYTPLTLLATGAIAAECFPRGVVNILAGGDALGAALTAHREIDKISFTGSVATGRRIMASAGAGLKRVTLELGGNDPALVLADADLDAAAEGIARSAFANCGQVCMAIKRVYVADGLHDALVERLVARAEAIRIGPGSDPASMMGPLQNRAQHDRVTALIATTRATPGAVFATGGDAVPGRGYFVRPAIVTGLCDDAPLVAEEQFGPVLPVLRFADVDDAVRQANATRFGLGASVWSRDIEAALAIARRIEAASVWINRHGGGGSGIPFGGMKDSGIGREHGLLGLQSYLEPQVLTVPH